MHQQLQLFANFQQAAICCLSVAQWTECLLHTEVVVKETKPANDNMLDVVYSSLYGSWKAKAKQAVFHMINPARCQHIHHGTGTGQGC